jgi:hypothetical protein
VLGAASAAALAAVAAGAGVAPGAGVAAGAGVAPGAGAGRGARPPAVLPAPPLPAVAVVVVARVDVARLARVGAIGLLSPGAGPTVSREAALASLVRGVSHNSSRSGLPGGKVVITLAKESARGPGAVTIYVQLPPPGTRPNTRRYPIAIVGGGYRGILRSPSTRIPGIVSIADVAPTAVALAKRESPRITSAPTTDAPARVARIDHRIDASKDAAYGATLAIIGATLFLSGLAWLIRAPALARAALLVAPAAVVTTFSLTLAGVGDSPALLTGIALAAPLGGLAAGRLLAGPRRLAAGLLATLVFVLVVLAAEPWAAGLSALGPEPGGGGRFFGIGNGMESLLLPAALLPGALLGLRWLAPVALLALGAIGLSRTGADGGGVIVLLAGTLVLAIRLRGRRITALDVAALAVLAVALAGAFVGLDALAGGSSHVTAAAGGGPFTIVTDIADRLDASIHKIVADAGVIIASIWSTVGLLFAATRRRRSPVLDAFLAAVVVSLLVNDTPVQVLALGVLMTAPLLSWESVRRARRTAA